MQVRDDTLVKLAREIAIDHLEADQLRELFNLSETEWWSIAQSPRFQKLLESELLAWQSAGNTTDRTRLKAGAVLEHFLPEANSRLHDPNESLNSKVELAKLISNISGINKPETVAGGSSGFSVTINLGSQPALHFEKLPVPVIEHGSGEGHK